MKRTRFLAITAAAAALVVAGTGPSQAAGAGALTDDTPSIVWSGRTLPGNQGACLPADPTCDHFTFVIPPGVSKAEAQFRLYRTTCIGETPVVGQECENHFDLGYTITRVGDDTRVIGSGTTGRGFNAKAGVYEISVARPPITPLRPDDYVTSFAYVGQVWLHGNDPGVS